MFTRWPELRGDVNDVIYDADGAHLNLIFKVFVGILHFYKVQDFGNFELTHMFHLTTPLTWGTLTQRLTSSSCTYIRL